MKYWILTVVFFTLVSGLVAQKKGAEQKVASNTSVVLPPTIDSAQLVDSLRRAAIRAVTRHSAIIPGWGQINNKQIWKVPVIYGALGFTTFLFFDNISQYRGLRQAYIYRLDTITTNDDLIEARYKPLSTNSIRFYRDEFRRNVDYSVLAFIILWGLNVADATVFAHLRGFDVSDDLSLKIQTPQYNIQSGYAQLGISLQPKPKKTVLKPLPGK